MTRASTAFTQRDLRDAFGLFATGVTVVTAVRPDGDTVGVTANSFTSVSLEPPLLLWCLSAGSSAAPAFTHRAPFAVHVLGHHQVDVALQFARRAHEKFTNEAHRRGPHPPHLSGALCRFDCRVHGVHDGGDHLIIVGEVLGLVCGPGAPLAFHAGRFGHFTADRGVGKVDIWEGLEDHGY
ncbi:MAG TPA: flavin reductase family protein [Steroidobacteraceae bacterium]|nr:flavin reductase family protein [Steroidobacteraceae bacterium]